jgi:hypothetical protein
MHLFSECDQNRLENSSASDCKSGHGYLDSDFREKYKKYVSKERPWRTCDKLTQLEIFLGALSFHLYAAISACVDAGGVR